MTYHGEQQYQQGYAQPQQQQGYGPPEGHRGGGGGHYGGPPAQYGYSPQQQQPYGHQQQGGGGRGYRRDQQYGMQPDPHDPYSEEQQYYGDGGGGRQQRPRVQLHRSHRHQPGDPHWYTAPSGGRGEVKQFRGVNEWQTSLLAACCNEPVTCLLGYVCPWCCVMHQRKKLLFGDMEKYQCCAGMWGQSCTARCNSCTKGHETMCLCLESFFCLGCAIHGNRWMILSHYNLKNDCCDICIMWLSCICSIVACLLGDENLENIADLIYYIVVGCMLAQHEHQMKNQGYPRIAAGPMR